MTRYLPANYTISCTMYFFSSIEFILILIGFLEAELLHMRLWRSVCLYPSIFFSRNFFLNSKVLNTRRRHFPPPLLWTMLVPVRFQRKIFLVPVERRDRNLPEIFQFLPSSPANSICMQIAEDSFLAGYLVRPDIRHRKGMHKNWPMRNFRSIYI